MLDTLTPPAIRYGRTEQYLDTGAGRIFDPFEAVRVATALVTEHLLDPARLNRLAWQHAADPGTPASPTSSTRSSPPPGAAPTRYPPNSPAERPYSTRRTGPS